ncbi:MAG: GGDEF domain-containing protein [Planctomycetes bacterium]|nr:GGDEF domain-containing protein [Planctomycetota bacterium]
MQTDQEPHTGQNRITELVKHISDKDVRPVFQPIVNVFTGSTVGYEVLSRRAGTGEGYDILLQRAQRLGIVWELERACRLAALRRISTLPEPLRNERYFLNVSPAMLGDARFAETFSPRALADFGIQLSNIVIELTEKHSITDYELFEEALRQYTNHGFNIALDDFGSGHSGLMTLISSRPHYLKLDMGVTRNVHQHPYKQAVVRSLSSLAASVGALLVAEGIESWDELEMLVRLGVRYGQGFLLGRPEETPTEIEFGFRRRLGQLAQRYGEASSNLDESVRRLMIRCETLPVGGTTTEELVRVFRRNPSLDHVVFLKGDKPHGLMTRDHLFQVTGWRYGYALFERKPADLVSKRSVLVVQSDMPVITLARLAMDRVRQDLYDPILVVDTDGAFLGTVTLKQLLSRSVELELQVAHDSNPLTNLPGNRTIQKWLKETLELPEYTVVYADLDHFKEYNDTYGFVLGDDMIRLASRVLEENLRGLAAEARLGHVGGDDFVVVARAAVSPEALARICREFDEKKLDLFNALDRDQRWFAATDRAGKSTRVPLTTLSLAVIGNDRLDQKPHPALLAQIAASLKKRVKGETKARGQSGYCFEQRRHPA